MARKPRLFGREVYHHIYAWGNNKRSIFTAPQHYRKYLHYLQQYGKWFHVDVVAYALMEWHVHLFVYDRQGKLPLFMNSVHGQYAAYFNHVTGRVGHVFGERYNNKIVQSNPYGMWLSRYIHRQPIEAGLFEDPQDYEWSSYRAYIGLEPHGFIKPEVVLEQFGKGRLVHQLYKRFVEANDQGPINWEDRAQYIVGDNDFVDTQEDVVERNMQDAVSPDDAFERVMKTLGVSSDVLLRPHGLNQRKARHKAFKMLVEEYGLSLAQVARLCRVSAAAVLKAVNRDQKI